VSRVVLYPRPRPCAAQWRNPASLMLPPHVPLTRELVQRLPTKSRHALYQLHPRHLRSADSALRAPSTPRPVQLLSTGHHISFPPLRSCSARPAPVHTRRRHRSTATKREKTPKACPQRPFSRYCFPKTPVRRDVIIRRFINRKASSKCSSVETRAGRSSAARLPWLKITAVCPRH